MSTHNDNAPKSIASETEDPLTARAREESASHPPVELRQQERLDDELRALVQDSHSDPSHSGRLAAISSLIAQGARPTPPLENGAFGPTDGGALVLSAGMKQPHVFKLLMQGRELDFNARDEDGDTALTWAVYLERVEVVEILANSADVDMNLRSLREGNGSIANMLPIEIALSTGSMECLQALLKSLSIDDLERENEKGLIPLDFIAKIAGASSRPVFTKCLNTLRADMELKREIRDIGLAAGGADGLKISKTPRI